MDVKLTGLSEENVSKLINILQILDLDTGKIMDISTLPTRLVSLQIRNNHEELSFHYEKDLIIIKF